MVLIYRGFEGNKVFKWSREESERVTVIFPAKPFFNRCINRVLNLTRAGKSVLAWGDPEGLSRLGSELKERHIPNTPFSQTANPPPN